MIGEVRLRGIHGREVRRSYFCPIVSFAVQHLSINQFDFARPLASQRLHRPETIAAGVEHIRRHTHSRIQFFMKEMLLRGAQGEAAPKIAIPGETIRGGVPYDGFRP